MSKVYKFPIVNLRQEIRDGHVSAGTKDLIRTILIELNQCHPNSWDKTFCEDMLTTSKSISGKQADHLERILDNILAKTEHPSFTPKLDLGPTFEG